MTKEHVSYGMINISRFSSNGSEFFGSDLTHQGGMSITISNGEVERRLSSERFFPGKCLIRVEMSHNQFVDAITSGMNTSGVPCTIKRIDGKPIDQINHVENKKELFSSEMIDTQIEYKNRIDGIIKMLDGKIGIKKAHEIKHELDVLKSHISSNTNFVMKSFDEAMEKTVTEAKHSVANYIDHKIHSLGIESLRDQLQISLDSESNKSIE